MPSEMSQSKKSWRCKRGFHKFDARDCSGYMSAYRCSRCNTPESLRDHDAVRAERDILNSAGLRGKTELDKRTAALEGLSAAGYIDTIVHEV